jgi:predicted amidohydrolase
MGTSLTLAGRVGTERVASAKPSSTRVAAVQMSAELANVEANLLKAERLTRLAFERGARWVVLPEFFPSAMAFHPEMADATRRVDGPPAQLLRTLARQGNACVGGSFLAWRNGNVYNSFVLALPDGSTLRHDKDYPSYWEACYYVGGSDDGVLSTPDGNVGAALCWEFVRSRTAARLKGKVGMVVGGSCWWGIEDTAPATDPMRKWWLDLLKATPSRFARLLRVPVVHASHAGRFEGLAWPGKPTPFPSSYLGET